MAPCPCCGYLILEDSPGSWEICGICGWEDDLVQLRWPAMRGGANKPSLIEAQESFLRIGAKSELARGRVRPPSHSDQQDPGWRPIDPVVDQFESYDDDDRLPWPDDRTVLFWWRPTFWRPTH